VLSVTVLAVLSKLRVAEGDAEFKWVSGGLKTIEAFRGGALATQGWALLIVVVVFVLPAIISRAVRPPGWDAQPTSQTEFTVMTCVPVSHADTRLLQCSCACRAFLRLCCTAFFR
jgi:hypothetical protein